MDKYELIREVISLLINGENSTELTFKTKRYGGKTPVDLVQETIDAYEARIDNLMDTNSRLHRNLKKANDEIEKLKGLLSMQIPAEKPLTKVVEDEDKTKMRLDGKCIKDLNPDLYKDLAMKIEDWSDTQKRLLDMRKTIAKAYKELKAEATAADKMLHDGQYVWFRGSDEQKYNYAIGIVKKNADASFITLHTLLYIIDDDRMCLLIGSTSKSEMIIHKNNNITVAVGNKGCFMRHEDYIECSEASIANIERLNNILAEYGYVWDAEKKMFKEDVFEDDSVVVTGVESCDVEV